MSDNLKAPEEIILTRLMRLNAIVYGVVAGFVAGSGLFIATVWLVIKGGANVGAHLGLLGNYFPGYSVTWVGSFVGFIYAFVCGFVIGYLVAFVYNAMVSRKGGASKGP